MSSLATAYAIINDPAHETVRRQLRVGLWYVARTLRTSTPPPTGSQLDLVARVLRGDELPHTIALWGWATDSAAQDAYTAAGNARTDAQIITWLAAAWPVLAGVA